MQSALKYLADRAGSLFALVSLSPLLVLIAIAIKVDDGGPVFYRQARLGKDAKPFDIWKFRSMIVNADDYLDAEGAATRNRITPVGEILRKYSLDELPQLINILIGQMSIVGPRPVLPSHLARYSEEQKRRFIVRPGLTGLAQVSGRNEIKWSRRLELDNEYVDNMSIALDIGIILKTVVMVITSPVDSIDRNPGDVDDLPKVHDSGSDEN